MQTSSYQIVLSVMGVVVTGVEALERSGSCCNRNGESKPNGKCSIARYGKNEKMRLLMCPRTSLQYVGKIIKSWLQFPPLLVNNELNRSNVIVIVKKTESEYWITKYHQPIGYVHRGSWSHGSKYIAVCD